MITIAQLKKRYDKLEVLTGIDLSFDQPGRISAILGPNGSGKTTLIKCILGMVLPTGGEICFDGRPVARNWAYRSRIGYLPQIARFPENLRVREVLALIQDIQGPQQRADQLIDRFELRPHLDKRFGALSGGTKQKVNLTLAFMYDKPVLMLDEPTSGLDPVALLQFKELVREAKAQGKIILLTTHIMSLVDDLADEIIFLLDGRVRFQGSAAQFKAETGEEDLERAIAGLLGAELPPKPGTDNSVHFLSPPLAQKLTNHVQSIKI